MYAACFLLHVGNRDVLLTPRLSVQPMIESGIIQDAQQEAFIWLSLCFAASSNINPEIDSLFCQSSVGEPRLDLLHLYFIFRASFQRREPLGQ